MRKISFIVVHCTATRQSATIESIRRYWREKLKWRNVGYHIIITPDGKAVRLAQDSQVTNGVAGHNSTSLHVSYIGGVDANGKAVDNRTVAQKTALLNVLTEWKAKYPDAKIQGHRDFPSVRKDCPSFDAKTEYRNL